MTPFNNTNSTFFADAKDKTIKMFEDMKNAKKYIYIEFFIISEGKLLDELLEILYEKAACGINVKIIFDDVGSRQTMSKKKVKEINKHQNIEMVSYNPLGVDLSLGVNFRDHRKIVIIDGEIGYTGGDNIADEYVHNIIRFGTWRDNAIRIEGDAVYNLLVMFVENWYMSTLKQIEIDHYIPNDKIVNTAIHFPFGDGPTNQNNPAYNLIKSMISNSHKYLYISTPYFIIDSEFIEEICLAANSGVDVKILVPHIPDKKIIFTLTRSHYGKLLKAGCEIYEYLPGFNHAKNIICDDLYALIGTINIDYRSLFLHFECGDLMMYDQQIHEMKKDFLDAIGKSTRISYETWINRPLRSKIIEFLATIASPLI